MGHAISRTKPSIVASERFARSPSIDVFCRGAGIAAIAATQQPVDRRKRRIRFIDEDEYISAASASIKVTGVKAPCPAFETRWARKAEPRGFVAGYLLARSVPAFRQSVQNRVSATTPYQMLNFTVLPTIIQRNFPGNCYKLKPHQVLKA